MKFYCIFLFFFFAVISCNDPSNKNQPKKTAQDNTELNAFFPVTDFLKGQIFDINSKGINPIKITATKNKKDSIWLKSESLNDEFADFLSPEIDSANMQGLYTENRFLDQTIDAFTFTYDAKNVLPDSITLIHWDVYIDPNTNTVKRIYMVKNISPDKTLQLTWNSDKFCKIIRISKDSTGNPYVESETTIKWDF